MQITAACPKCDARYQFDSALIGKKVRCGNAACREVFEVRQVSTDAARQARPAGRDRRAPTFDADSGEHQTVAASDPDAPREADWSKLPPPPVRRQETAGPAAELATVERKPDSGRASAEEVMAMMGLAPTPAENGATGTNEAEDYAVSPNVVELEEIPADSPIVDVDEETDYAKLYHQYGKPARRLWLWWILVVMFIVLAGGSVGLFLYSRVGVTKQKQKAIDEANKVLESGDFDTANTSFDKLIANYANDPEVPKWRFNRDYAKALIDAKNSATPPDKRLTELLTYLANVRDGNDPNKELIEQRKNQIRDAFVRIGDSMLKDAKKKADAKDFVGARKSLDDYNKTKDPIGRYATPDIKPPIPADLTELAAKITEKIKDDERYTDYVKSIDERLKNPTFAMVTFIEKEAREKGYDNRQEVVERLTKARKTVESLIVFKPSDKPAQQAPTDTLNSLILGPNIDKIPENPNIVFAVARGVLYALADAKGQIVWAARVGIDSSALPVRVPKAGNSPALAIVSSADGKGLIAREVLTGKGKWFQELPASLRGQPLLVEGRLIVPLADEKGTIVEIDSRDGRQFGALELNQKIGAGAALQAGTTRVFVPAESLNVLVLDAREDLKFITSIATGHGAGSLRGEPVVVGGVNQANGALEGNGYMILAQSNGFANMQLRSFEIPPEPSQARPGIEQTLPGWSSFAPACDQEKVAIVTDTGAFALFGINQPHNDDPNVFPLNIEMPKTPTTGRGMIVHAEENDFWYIAGGELKYERMGFDRKEGRKLAPGWKAPIKVGTPLHAAQVSADRSILYIVTQENSPPAWLATAVKAQTGEILWQRPLGLSAQGDPVRFGDFLLQADRGAGIYSVDTKAQIPAGKAWDLAGEVLAAPRQDVFGEPYLLPHASGKVAVLVFETEDGHKLNAIWITPGQKASSPETVAIPAPLAGAPVLMDKTLVLPLTDGGLHRWTIGDKNVQRGPDWRATGLGENVRAFLVLLGKDNLLVSDGHHGLAQYQWAPGAEYQGKPKIAVANRIVATPLIVPGKEGQTRVAIADAGGKLYMFEGDPLVETASLSWNMPQLRAGNQITAGPFLVQSKGESRLIVVGDNTNIVCLNPSEEPKAWSYSVKEKGLNGEGVSVRPLQIGESLVLADVSGRYFALDAETGSRLADPFPGATPLPAAPATMPVALGSDRLFAPLSDGTVLLIPTESLLPKK